jgi:NTE family protein
MKILLVLVLTWMVSACSSVRPWQNLPMQVEPRASASQAEVPERSLTLIVTFSGGGARAAAFGYGVLDGLRQTPVQWHGSQKMLLDELDLVSGVSGGSIIAAYYAAFGRETFPAFEQEFLRKNFQDSLVGNLANPGNLHDLSSPWFGRTHLLAKRLDELYKGKTFGDLGSQPRLLISATDLSLGSPFEFTWSQFALICSDLATVPLSFAVASSSAVPLALSPMTLKNHNETCARDLKKVSPMAQNDYRVRLLRGNQRSYLNAAERPYIHLVDGGLADNLGLRSLLDRSRADGGLRSTVRSQSKTPIQKLVIVAVNAERAPSDRIDASDEVPGMLQVLDALLFGSGARATQETLELLNDTAQAWRDELSRAIAQDDTFTPDAKVHVINVNLRDAPEELRRNDLLRIPTAFSISQEDVTQLIAAGRHILHASPEYKALLQSLKPD